MADLIIAVLLMVNFLYRVLRPIGTHSGPIGCTSQLESVCNTVELCSMLVRSQGRRPGEALGTGPVHGHLKEKQMNLAYLILNKLMMLILNKIIRSFKKELFRGLLLITGEDPIFLRH